MPIKFKDYYETLKIPRTASEGDIKSAYRKLARKHHPDLVTVGKKASEEKFKEINEAYNVLNDKEKKSHYDELGPDWEHGGGGTKKDKKGTAPARGATSARKKEPEWSEDTEDEDSPSNGRDVFSDFFETIFGGTASAGADKTRKGAPGTFGRSKESSRTYTQSERGRDIESQMELSLEEVAHGTKRSIWVERPVPCSLCSGSGSLGRQGGCHRCKSTGHIPKAKELTVTIPEGIKEGDKVRLAGQGEPGTNGGDGGDRFIEVKFRAHDQFTVAEDHLEMGLDVMPWEVVLGTELKITTLYGDVILKIPSGSQNGQKFRLRGKGLPIHKGEKQDLYVKIAVNLPSSITPEEKEHYLGLARLAKKG